MSGGGGGAGGISGAVNPTRCNEKPWDLWVSEIGRASPRRDRSTERKEARRRRRAGVGLLRRDAMALHGLHPQSDELNAVVCHMCGAAVKCSAAYRHLLERHSASSEPILPPPRPHPPVKLKLPGRARHRRERLPTPPLLEVPLELPTPTVAPPRTSPVAPRIAMPKPEVYYAEPEPLSTPVVQSEMQVCVDGELPVVSIQDELPLGENITDDIFDIMNSEGIQSADDPDSTSWKNIIRDIGSIQEISFPQTDTVPTQENYSASVDQMPLPAYTISEDLSSIQFNQTSLPTVLDAVALNPAPPPPPPSRNSRPKSSKTKFNSREYDPNKHCGVITAETQKPCTRSLTCKAHTLSLRRTVEGRIKPFDTLLAEHKAAREASANTTTPVVAPAPPPPPAPISIPLPPSLLVNTSIDISSFNLLTPDQQVIYTSLLNPDDTSVLPDTSSITSMLSPALPADQFLLPEDPVLSVEVPILSIASPVKVSPSAISQSAAKPETIDLDSTPTIVPSDVCWYPSAPRPLALCTFNASHAGGAIILGKKFATVRSNIKSSLSRSQSKTVASSANSYYNFSQNSMTSLSKTVHMNNATKCSKTEVRKLIVTCPAMCGVKTEPSYSEVGFSSSSCSSGVRHNGHAASGKRSALDAEDCESKRSRQSVLRNNVKVAKHMGQGDMLELSFMFDPLMADEKC